jgi:hypothetical protein
MPVWLRVLLCAHVALIADRANGAEDPALSAAQEALEAGLPAQSIQLLRGHPGLAHAGAERLMLARAYLALGRGPDALQSLGATADPAWSDAWPPISRGAAQQCAGEAMILLGDEQGARASLDRACRTGSVAVDRCLALLAELCQKSGDLTAARDYARVLWQEWPRSPYRGHGGMILASLLASQAPDQAQVVLAGVRIADNLSPSDRLSAAELLCSLLLEHHPGDCLVVAEQESRRLTASPAGSSTGTLPLFRALALSVLEPHEGMRALSTLSESLRATPAAQAMVERLRSAPVAGPNPDLVIERARAEAQLGRVDTARSLLVPLAAEHPPALVALAALPGGDLSQFISSPSTHNPAASLALGRALVIADRSALGWPLLAQALAQRDAGKAAELSIPALLYWCERAAKTADPGAVPALRQRLLALDEPGQETGLAWCDEAERRSQEGGDAEAAWERAAKLLPPEHPWAPAAAWRAARSLLERGMRLADARVLVEVQAWGGYRGRSAAVPLPAGADRRTAGGYRSSVAGSREPHTPGGCGSAAAAAAAD